MTANSTYPELYSLPLRSDKYEMAIANTIDTILGLKKGERLVVVTSRVKPEDWGTINETEQTRRRETYTIAKMLSMYACRSGDNLVQFIHYDATLRNAVEPPDHVLEKMMDCGEDTAMILMPWDSLTHTQARKAANEKGARIMSSPHFTAEMMENGGPMCADYSEVKKISEELAAALSEADSSHVTAPNGTELYLFYEPSPAHPDTGDVTLPGSCSNLPAGEAYRALQRKGYGKLKGVLQGEEIEIDFKDGLATAVLSDNAVSTRVRGILFPDYEDENIINRRQFAEDGTGTNRMLAQDPMRWTYSPLTAEKILGTKHFAPGDNSTFGGTNKTDYHEDIVVFKPTWELGNGRILMRDGELIL